MTAPGFQDQIPTTNWMYPVIDADGRACPKAFGQQPWPQTALLFTAEEVGGRSQGLDRRMAAARRATDPAARARVWRCLAPVRSAHRRRVVGHDARHPAIGRSGIVPGQSPYYRGVIVSFTLWQAALSTLLSVGSGASGRAGAGAARRLSRARAAAAAVRAADRPADAGRRSSAFVAVYGRAGWINRLHRRAGGTWPLQFIYGLAGILIAPCVLQPAAGDAAAAAGLGAPSPSEYLAAGRAARHALARKCSG